MTDFLRDKDLLLLVDNCEHLIGAAADVVERLLGACRSLRVLTTSREALGVPGEAIYQVPSLGIPDTLDHADLEAVGLDRGRPPVRGPGDRDAHRPSGSMRRRWRRWSRSAGASTASRSRSSSPRRASTC